jgi:hypothetical protein
MKSIPSKENISSKVGKRSARQQYDMVKNIRIMPGTTFLKTEVRILYVLKVGNQTSKVPYKQEQSVRLVKCDEGKR